MNCATLVRVTVRRAGLAAANVLATLLLVSCAAAATPSTAGVPQLRVEVLAELPHDPSAFTEGLEIANGVLYEGTGLSGRSELRELDPGTGAVRRTAALPAPLFGEGITVVGVRIWQLTWKDGVAVEWDRTSLSKLREVSYQGEGWGLCNDVRGRRLIMSAGTDRLQFRDPVTFAATGSVTVRMGGRPLTAINELECVDGQVWANVWQSDLIVRIDPASGEVTAAADAAGLLPASRRDGADVLNGIAAVPGTDEFLVTGKLWPTAFRVRFVPAER
jgi:glutamine cyclotransferase